MAIALIAPTSYAASRKIENFLESVKDTPYNFHFLKEGLSAVANFNALSANDPNSTALYFPQLGLMRLPETALDSKGRIKPLEDLSNDDFSSIAHEAFHAYRANFINLDESLSVNKAWLTKRSRDLFLNVRRDRREQVLEEAYAIYLEAVVRKVRELKTNLREAIGNDKQCRIQMRRAASLWEDLNEEAISSDYRRDSLFDYVVDGFRLVAGLEIHRVVDVEKPIELVDKFWVQQEILDGRFLKPFEQVFASELQDLACTTIANN